MSTVEDIENNVCTLIMNCLSTHETVILAFINTKNNFRVSAEIDRHESTYIIFLTPHNESKNDDKKQ